MIFERILVTGAGGDISIALAEIARSSGSAAVLIGTDTRNRHAGQAVFDIVEQVPRADDPDYVERLEEVVDRHRPDLIVPASEAELDRLLRDDLLETFAGIPVLSANREAISVGLDKLATARHLASAGINMPWTRLIGSEEPAELPCIVKARHGQGSKGLAVADQDNVEHFRRTRVGHVWQQLLGDDEQEYTCGLYAPAQGSLRTIVFRRKLQGGLTGEAQLVFDERIERLLQRAADALQLRGAINVQLRVANGIPMIFEINPRFSSTVGFRHLTGFRDFVWSLLERRGLDIEDYAPPSVPLRFYRIGRIVSTNMA